MRESFEDWQTLGHQVLITDLATGEVLSAHLIEPNKTYWRNQNKEPGRWPNSSK